MYVCPNRSPREMALGTGRSGKEESISGGGGGGAADDGNDG